MDNDLDPSSSPTVEEVIAAYAIEPDEVCCDICASQGVRLNVSRREAGTNAPHNFLLMCDICFSTYLGVYAQHPQQHDREVLALMKFVAFVGNEILKRLPPPPDQQ